jgi:hypothetical protein
MMAFEALTEYRRAMSFVPTLCLECWRVHLVSLVDARTTSEVACKTCGADACVVPGCSYGALDREAFEELSAIVAEGNLTPMEAQSHAMEVERGLWSGAYHDLLEGLCVRLPGLLPHQVAAGKNSGAQRRILLRLKTILEALATARRQSAAYPIIAAPAAPSAARS